MRIVFMGTPDFAVPCLQMLLNEGFDVVGVVTQPDKPKGRGNKMTFPPVKEVALKNNIPVYQPTTLKDGSFESVLNTLKIDLIVVVAYGKILPRTILTLPKHGCINVHASLLPKYRGAGPIQWSVLNGEQETGITTMQMDVGLDTGDMLCQSATPIGVYETAGQLHDRLSQLGASTLLETLKMLQNGTLQPKTQEEAQATYAPMLTKQLSPIDWEKDADTLSHLICGLNPWPVATTQMADNVFKVYQAQVVQCEKSQPAGTVLEHIKGQGLLVQAGKDALLIQEIQFEGKKRMHIEAYMRGKPIAIGTRLGENI
ncbi:MAG: methionyl-tRNA formyltransferase [Hyphomonadaceae bacterium]|nr:methionyl-tRNA formyltransferase [Clostridia bacterium]